MKLRINGNSLRLRLTPDEVSDLCQNGRAEDRCKIGDHQCIYSIVAYNEDELSVNMVNGQVQVNIPKSLIANWEQNDKVGFEHTDYNNLFILVEKDFKCLQPRRHEKEQHLYPNPTKK